MRTRGARRCCQGERSPRRAAAQRLCLPPHTMGARAPARRAAAVGPSRSPTPPSPAATRARSRTVEVDRRDRRVLLERGRQSFRAVGADAVPCGGAAHPRPRAQVSVTRFQAEARAQGKLARERAGPDAAGRASAARGARPRKGSVSLPAHWARLRGGPRPWAQAVPQPLNPPRPPASTLAHR
jgi:hypothetical protein